MSNAAVKQTNTNFDLKEKVCASTIFPDAFQPGELSVVRRINRHPDCLSGNPNYIPDPVVLRRLLAWWHAPAQPMAFGLVGETGTGKTEMLLYVADLLNEPVYMIKCHPALMPEDLEGSRTLVDGKTPFMPGPAAKGYMNGGLVIFDEADKLSLTTQPALHGLVEGKPWPIETIGRTISKNPDCRIACTGNTTGEGGNDFYVTSQRMDDALRSRIGWYRTNYPQPTVELKIINKTFPNIPKRMAHEMVRFGNALRDARLGSDRKGIDDPIGCVFSTRTLFNWAFHTMAFGPQANWRESLDFAMGGSVDPESRNEVDEIIQRHFDDLIDKNTKDVIGHYSVKQQPLVKHQPQTKKQRR